MLVVGVVWEIVRGGRGSGMKTTVCKVWRDRVSNDGLEMYCWNRCQAGLGLAPDLCPRFWSCSWLEKSAERMSPAVFHGRRASSLVDASHES